MNMKTLGISIASLVLVPGLSFADGPGPKDDAPSAVTPATGWASEAAVGLAEFPTNSAVGLGTDVKAMIGRESMFGQLGVTPGLELEAAELGTNAPELRAYSARAKVRLAYYGEHWIPFASVGVGYSYVSSQDSVGGMTVSGSDNMLSLSAGAGVAFRITNRVAVGPYVQYAPAFEPALNQFVSFGAQLISR